MKRGSQWAWDIWCVASIIGIWPRFIEPSLLNVTRIALSISSLPSDLVGIKILHFSDLHWSSHFSNSMISKLIQKIKQSNPDIILFTGDFLCRAHLEDKERLKFLLNSLRAPHGCFAVLGNHDYSQFVTVNQQGDYDVEEISVSSDIAKGFKRLFNSASVTSHVTERARSQHPNSDLIALIEETSFQVLNNETIKIPFKGTQINLCGLEEYSLGRFNPQIAFQGYDARFPGIVLSHNPDTVPILSHYPGDIILSGHTHGGQVNLPWIWKRFTKIEHLEFKRGLKRAGEKWAYINRGISSVMKFRWFSIPELTLITLQRG